VEEHVLTQAERIVLKSNASLCLRLLQLIQRLEAPIGDGLVRQGPEMFARLQLWRVGGQKVEVNTFWHNNLVALMPASPI
jgi:hypothetical protein